ncbi:MAG: hypothetical protein ACOY3P_26995 [Planctomycetota bacterium]
MDAELQKLLQAWLQDDVDEKEAGRLLKRLRDDGALRKAFVDEIVMLGRLKAVQAGEPRWLQLEDVLGLSLSSNSTDASFESDVMRAIGHAAGPKPQAGAARSRRSRHWMMGALALGLTVAAVASAVLYWNSMHSVGPQQKELAAGSQSEAATSEGNVTTPRAAVAEGAALTFTEQAHWKGAGPASGRLLEYRVPYRLEAGAIRLEMQGRGIVSIAAPAAFTVIDAITIQLESGKLAARLPDDQSELLVRAGELEIRDLGTAFGVTADPRGAVELAVFDGSVAVRSPEGSSAAREQTLTEGEAISSSAENRERRGIPFDPRLYQDIWPLTIGIDDVSNIVDFVPPGPHVPLQSLADDHKLFLLPEKLNHRVTRPITLDLVKPGQAWPTVGSVPHTIGRKKTVSSYLLVYRPEHSGYRDLRALSGSICFQHPILGVAVDPRNLHKSDHLFGIAGIDYESFANRRLEDETTEEGDLPPDSLRISEDGRQLYFNLYVGAYSDHIRVLVDESDAQNLGMEENDQP